MATVVAGSSYSIMLTITNKSTKGGTPVAANLGVGIVATAGSYTLISEQVSSQSFAAGQARTFTHNMYVPAGSGGQSGSITAWIQDPAGSVIAQASGAELGEAPYVPPPTYYYCPYCSYSAESQYELDVHIETAHPPEPEPTDEELIYQNWLRTGGVGSISYWRSIGSPLYYTPAPEPEPVLEHHYRVVYLDGSTRIISWVPDPVTKPNLWDFVDRDDLLSWTYLGLY